MGEAKRRKLLDPNFQQKKEPKNKRRMSLEKVVPILLGVRAREDKAIAVLMENAGKRHRSQSDTAMRWLNGELNDMEFGIDTKNSLFAGIECNFDERAIAHTRRLLEMVIIEPRRDGDSAFLIGASDDRDGDSVFLIGTGNGDKVRDEVRQIGKDLYDWGGEPLMFAIAEVIPLYACFDLEIAWKGFGNIAECLQDGCLE